MMPVSEPGSQTTSLISLAFSPESVMLPLAKSSNCHADEWACFSNEYRDVDSSATFPDGLGVATPRRGALIICLCAVSSLSPHAAQLQTDNYSLGRDGQGPGGSQCSCNAPVSSHDELSSLRRSPGALDGQLTAAAQLYPLVAEQHSSRQTGPRVPARRSVAPGLLYPQRATGSHH